ncbi:RDD family protein [Dactylosporangium sp. CA-139114]|uniref:RDD family protein n=1 Tax=Dactylosporangium sp. CA-139114 TaxID=3239931 RepID=UPI003D97D152
MTDPSAAAAPGERLVSGEAVELEVRVARAGSRVLALMLDIVLQCLLLIALLFATALVVWLTLRANVFDGGLFQAIIVILMAVTLIGYPVFWETLLRGRTPGKAAMGLRVVRDDGGPVRFRHALARALVGLAVEWPGLLFPVVSWLGSLGVLMLNPSGKRIGDLVAGTIVIHERTPAGWGWVPAMPPPLARWAALLDLTGLDDSLALAVRHFLARNREIAEPARTALGQALASEVSQRTTPPPPPGVPGWAYLAAVLAERHRRSSHRLAKARAASAAVWPGLYAVVTPRFQPPKHQPGVTSSWAPPQPPADRPPMPRPPVPHA